MTLFNWWSVREVKSHLYKGTYQTKDHPHFWNILSAHFPENHCFHYFEECQQTQKEIFLFTNF